jgi:hypothetical protein
VGKVFSVSPVEAWGKTVFPAALHWGLLVNAFLFYRGHLDATLTSMNAI